MAMRESVARGFRIVGSSWSLLWEEKQLLIFPVLSIGVAAVLALGATGIAATLAIVLPSWELAFEVAGSALALFLVYVSFVFFGAALVAAATIRLKGGSPSVADGLRIASSKLGKILRWAFLSATIGVLLRIVAERVGILARAVVALIGALWSVTTFFIVPVLLYEDLSAWRSVRRSAQIFRAKWGEQVGGAVAISSVFILLFVPFGALAIVLSLLSPLVGVAVAGTALLALAASESAVYGVFRAALYEYASNGVTPPEFDSSDLRASFGKEL